MDQRIEAAQMNIFKCYIAQMDSGMKIASIIADHNEDKILDGDCVISGLVYRLMVPMSNEEMMDSLNKANDIMNDNSDNESNDDSDYDSDSDSEEEDEKLEEEGKKYDIELKDKPWRNIKKNRCECDVCSKVRECLDGYKSYETYDPMVTKLKDGIKAACDKYKIII